MIDHIDPDTFCDFRIVGLRRSTLANKVDAKIPSPVELQLLALVTSERTGRQVARLYRRVTGNLISYGTLYTTLRRLRERGSVTVRDAKDEDGRIRFFEITSDGARELDDARVFYGDLSRFEPATVRPT